MYIKFGQVGSLLNAQLWKEMNGQVKSLKISCRQAFILVDKLDMITYEPIIRPYSEFN